jgi:hypothetical protein
MTATPSSVSTPSPAQPINVVKSTQSRQCDRFHARNTANLTAELLVLHEDEVVRYDCQMADISVGGCAVRVNLLTPGEVSVAVLRISDNCGSLDVEVAGRLCWNQQTAVASNTFGFRFRRPMAPEVIESMVAAGLVTRRQETRVTAGIPVQIRRAHGAPLITHAFLHDFSTTGLRVRVDRELMISERLLITTDVGASGSVSVKWVKAVDNSFECGCVFQNLSSARAINDSLSVGS